MNNQNLNVLLVSASARQTDSVTRRFADEMLEEFHKQYKDVTVQHRNVATGVPFVDEHWVNANFTPEEKRTDKNKAALTSSDGLVKELQKTDILLIATPIYNFSIPASLKAWIDQITRVDLTFKYTADGPVGMLKDKKAYVVLASGGTQIGSDIDFGSTYLRHILEFIGINDISFILADCFNENDEKKIEKIRRKIYELAQCAA